MLNSRQKLDSVGQAIPGRRRLTVRGIVQGVGFRPFVYGLAEELALSGWVLNNSRGVLIEVEGSPSQLSHFENRLRTDAPPLSSITNVAVEVMPCVGGTRFEILTSLVDAEQRALIPADVATCDLCAVDVAESVNRRFGYPFTNCTNCGPRFTIIQSIPYDRPNTTMSAFSMCSLCESEYHNPRDRRFHAQPNACPVCGPRIWVQDSHRHHRVTPGKELEQTAQLLREGMIVAVKGLGGFHLTCDARNDEAVSELRRRKGRSGKPFAIMVANLEEARKLVVISAEEERLLTTPERPILLLPVKDSIGLSPQVAPGFRYLGIMLPYTPLHHLLMSVAPPALVMTSGNLSEEPIAHKNEEATIRLGAIADGFLMHDREIHTPCDDSVMRPILGKVMPIRRSRGYVPRPIEVGFDMPPILACGAEQKNTFCLTQESSAILSQHIGDLDNAETLEYYERAIEHMKALFRVAPEIVAHDMHPDYLSTRYAEALDIPRRAVQHHHAHVASCLAEHRMSGPVIGVSFDGTGYGTDGAIWGGEILVADLTQFRRAAHLKYVPMPGGAAAIKDPARMAYAHLQSAGLEEHAAELLGLSEESLRILSKQVERRLNSPLTSSMGRLFDSVSAIAGICSEATYEGEAAVALEMCAEDGEDAAYAFHISDSSIEVDAAPVIAAVVEDIDRGVAKSMISARFHNAVTEIIVTICERIRKQQGIAEVALTGGCFQNVRLVERTALRLLAEGFKPLIHRLVPPNDGGISLGQAVVAAASRLDDHKEQNTLEIVEANRQNRQCSKAG